MNETEQDNQYLTFKLAEELYSLPISKVKVIEEYIAITFIPLLSRHIKGVINFRGNVIPVIDLAILLTGKSNPITDRTCIIIVEIYIDEIRVEAGILVDSVCEVLGIDANNIEPPPSFGAGIPAHFIQGIAKTNEKVFIVLDVQYLFALQAPPSVTQSFAASSPEIQEKTNYAETDSR